MAVKNKKRLVNWEPTNIKAEMLKKYPPAHHPGHHHHARLHLRRLQGRHPRADPRHRQHHPRPHRLRILLLADPAQPDRRLRRGATTTCPTASPRTCRKDIIFGGEKKLEAAIQEAYELFHPKAIAVFATCPVGLIGDDMHAVAKKMKEKLGDCNVFAFSCEGYKGVSQSAGHHIANNQVFKHVVGENDERRGRFHQPARRVQHRRRRLRDRPDLLRAAASPRRHLLRQLHLRPVRNSAHHGRPERGHVPPLDQLRGRHDGDQIRHTLGQGQLHRRRGHGQDPRKIAQYFDDKAHRPGRSGHRRGNARREEAGEVKPRTEGKTAMLFVGGSRAHHYQELFEGSSA